MTPKEKANQLYNQWHKILPDCVEVSHETIMNCALTAVGEIISLMIKFHGRHIANNLFEIDYWQQVKTEIENL